MQAGPSFQELSQFQLLLAALTVAPAMQGTDLLLFSR